MAVSGSQIALPGLIWPYQALKIAYQIAYQVVSASGLHRLSGGLAKLSYDFARVSEGPIRLSEVLIRSSTGPIRFLEGPARISDGSINLSALRGPIADS